MIDNGFGLYLVIFGVLIAACASVVVFLVSKYAFRWSFKISLLIAAIFAIGGFLISPHVFLFILHLKGISLF